ncbi:MAG: prepilin-type N-terminal cleavage/methylation domain-containing protein [Kiritimatiellales bacterium]
MRRPSNKAGMTLVEVMIAMFLVSIVAIIVYTEMLLAYRILARSRARLEAQSIAFDNLWEVYNRTDPVKISGELYSKPTPEWSLMSTNGWVECHILAEQVVSPRYWEIAVTVWPPTNSPLQIGTNPLARAAIWRWDAKR